MLQDIWGLNGLLVKSVIIFDSCLRIEADDIFKEMMILGWCS